jgi:hypothetical protein
MTSDLDLNPIKARLNAAPELHPYATAKGGVVLLTGPCPYVKAYAAVVFVEHAPTDLAALIQEVERLRASLSLFGLICQAEARGWLWEVGCNQGPAEPDRRYYAYLRLPTLDPLHEDVADEREGWGATVEDALRQAIAALPPDPYRREP